jgi:hypothetical protein
MNLAEANRILRLSDSQLAIVRQAAVPLSPSARDRYLKTVAAELAEAERVDDATVKVVVDAVLCTLVDRPLPAARTPTQRRVLVVHLGIGRRAPHERLKRQPLPRRHP